MRFRTKLFVAWALLVLALYAAMLWPVHEAISSSFDGISRQEFAGTKQSLRDMESEQTTRMRQEASLIMNIPELRALIAETSAEITQDNLESLNERLDSLSRIAGVPAIFVLDQRAKLIAQNGGSPWPALSDLRQFLETSRQARALVQRVYQPANSSDPDAAPARACDGTWEVGDQLFQVVAVPLIFDSGDSATPADIQGALVMASPLTDAIAEELASRHHCSVSFVSSRSIVASSLSAPLRSDLAAAMREKSLGAGPDFTLQLGSANYRSSFEPLIDPSSKTPVGGTLIQASLADAQSIQHSLWGNLALIALIGLSAAAVTSFIFSNTVTRPVQSLLDAVRKVSAGNLSVSIDAPAEKSGELGELARAFNHMVEELRSRRDLERQVEESRAASDAKSQFLANMSHEIRTPLNGVLGMTELLRQTELSAKQERFTDLLQTSGKMLANIINDILDFSKIEAGKLELESIDFDLRKTIQEVLDVLSPKAGAKSLQLTADVQPALDPGFRGDPKRLQQILLNLMNNAIKFTESGHVSVTAMLEKSLPDATVIRFEISDTGIGVPQERIGRLFQSFTQVDASTTRKYGGTGLGLAICKQLTELMGGQIGVTSAAGKGSTFWFTARFLCASAALQPAAPPPGEIRPAHRGHILIAEDNEVNQLVVSEALHAAGHTTDIAATGKDVLAALRRTRYDLILMDCQMPEMDGFEATRQIRRQEESAAQDGVPAAHIPIIALTANAVKSDRDDCLAAGMDDYLSKPIDFAALTETLARHLPGASALPNSAASPAVATPPPAKPPGVQAAMGRDPIDLAALSKRYANSPEFIFTLLERFEKQVAGYTAALEKSVADREYDTLIALAHSLRGLAGALMAEELVRLTVQFESAAKDQDFSAMQAGLAAVQKEMQSCMAQIPAISSSRAPKIPRP